MTAGLPGTGIGGLYYLVLVILMPVREAYLTARGRSSRARWRIVGQHVALGGGIVGALFALGWMIHSLLGALLGTAFGPATRHMMVNATTVINRNAMVATVSVLAGVLLIATLWHLVESTLGIRSTPAPARDHDTRPAPGADERAA